MNTRSAADSTPLPILAGEWLTQFQTVSGLVCVQLGEVVSGTTDLDSLTGQSVLFPPGVLPLGALRQYLSTLESADHECTIIVDSETSHVCALLANEPVLARTFVRELRSGTHLLTEKQVRRILQIAYELDGLGGSQAVHTVRLPEPSVVGEWRSETTSIFETKDDWWADPRTLGEATFLTYDPSHLSHFSAHLPLSYHLHEPSIVGAYARSWVQPETHFDHSDTDAESEWRLSDVDIIAVTTDRWRSVRHLLKSIRRVLGLAPGITVVAQTPPSARWRYLARRYGANIIHVEYDLGLSASRNTAVRATSRPLVWLMDDDFQIDSRCRFDDALKILADRKDLDVLGGNLLDVPTWSTPQKEEQSQSFAMRCIQGAPELVWVRLEDMPRDRRFVDPCTYLEYCDIVDNFAIFRRKTTFDRGLLWNPELKINSEHQDLYLTFLEAGSVTIARTNALKVRNVRVQPRRYRHLRNRNHQFFGRFFRAHSLSSFKILGDWERLYCEDGRISARSLDAAWGHRPEYNTARDFT